VWGLAFACTVPKPKFCGSTTYEFGGQSLSGMSREFRWNSGLPDFRDARKDIRAAFKRSYIVERAIL
jgi:hypothetical protein